MATSFGTLIPSKLSHIYSLFLRRGGTIRCRVAGGRRYSYDLPQGGLEIPCVMISSRRKAQGIGEIVEVACHYYHVISM